MHWSYQCRLGRHPRNTVNEPAGMVHWQVGTSNGGVLLEMDPAAPDLEMISIMIIEGLLEYSATHAPLGNWPLLTDSPSEGPRHNFHTIKVDGGRCWGAFWFLWYTESQAIITVRASWCTAPSRHSTQSYLFSMCWLSGIKKTLSMDMERSECFYSMKSSILGWALIPTRGPLSLRKPSGLPMVAKPTPRPCVGTCNVALSIVGSCVKASGVGCVKASVCVSIDSPKCPHIYGGE